MKTNEKPFRFLKGTMLMIFLLSTLAMYSQQILITGSVTDGENMPLGGANVLIKGTTVGVQTDFDGNYSIQAASGDVLVFSYIGFQSQEVVVSNQTTLNITLVAGNQLDEVVVIGYGTQKKSSLTASVASVDVEELAKLTTHDASIALQGRAPGVEILTQGGIAGADVNVVIRGVSTFGNASPLYIIDGAFSTAGLRAVNPADIQSIEILKDGAAAAIYGSRAANGVVIITTKKGKKGAPKIQLSSSVGFQTPSRKLDYLNADQWRSFANQVSDNSGLTRAPENDAPNLSNGVNTDWQDLWINNAPIYTANASISGGGESTTYSTSASYLKQDGILEFSEFEKYNLRLNLGYKKGKFQVSENLGLAYYKNRPNDAFTLGEGRVGFNLPTVPNRDGNGNFVAGGQDFYIEGDERTNRYAAAANTNRNISNVDITGNIDLSYDFFEGLKYKLGFSGSYNSTRDYSDNNVYDIPVLGQPNVNLGRLLPSISDVKATTFNYTIDNILTYDNTFGKHDVSVLAGYSQFRENFQSSGLSATFESAVEDQLAVFNGGGNISGSEFKSLLTSLFGRLNYNYDSKYLFSASVRRDKSSKFGPDNRVGVFPSFSAGWNVHNEDFFPKDGIVNRIKLRASYGELGVNFIDPYQYISVAYGPIPAIFGNSQNGPSDRSFGRITQLADPNLKWETSKTTDFGLELGFFDNSLSFTADYFVKTNTDLLAEVPLPPSVGQTLIINEGNRPVINSAEVENKGFEFLIDYKNNKNEFKYNVSFNVATLRNEVIKLGDNVSPILGGIVSSFYNDRPTITDAGSPIGSFYGYRTEGIDQTTGQFIFQDVNNDGEITDDDKVILGDPFPDFTYGLNFSGEYKNFDFSLFFQGVQGNEIYSQIKYTNYFLYSSNVVTDVLNSWTPSNTNTNIPIAITDNKAGGSALPSDFYIEDGSYLRLKNVQIGYSLPQSVLDKLKLDKIRLFLGAQNLFTITDYSGYDPEVSSDAQFNRGVDFNGFPNATIVTFGVNLSL